MSHSIHRRSVILESQKIAIGIEWASPARPDHFRMPYANQPTVTVDGREHVSILMLNHNQLVILVSFPVDLILQNWLTSWSSLW